ncbi:hypothetical protein FOB63_000342 [Clavispora lusitaniae]|uniref:uncharacterized protein n=1 Tax=Clavispora lusitaniae TaxID=36911 RepID=UPI00202BCF81|nr:hypothetical protein FOB63_000342 [Clavispora lusitaniae]
MDDSYFGAPPDPHFAKGLKCYVVLRLLRVKRPWLWALLVSTNPALRRFFASLSGNLKHPRVVARRVNKSANLVSCGLLYAATANNYSIPKDYLSLYIVMTYYGELNPPSSNLVVSPSTQSFSKLHAYKEHGWVRWLYRNKHKVIFPAIFAQILSNYLTPTTYRLNHKYLSSSIKNYILNPVWTNFHMSAAGQYVNWAGLLKSYILHNGAFFAYYYCSKAIKSAIASFYTPDDQQPWKHRFLYAIHRANAVANFIYSPQLLSMLLLSLTSPLLAHRKIRSFYLKHTKQFIKYYIKVIGFIAAFVSMQLADLHILPNEEDETGSARHLSTSFMDALNMYLFRLIVLSKWRIVKSNHPWFRFLRYGTWDRIETFVMCYGVWKLMNITDHINLNRFGQDRAECERLATVPLLRLIQKIMA